MSDDQEKSLQCRDTAHVIYGIYRWVLDQAVDVARKAFYSAIPKNREQSRNIPHNCKTFPDTLNGFRATIINVVITTWVLLAVAIIGVVGVGLAISLVW
jgi:hypothetical protein